MLSRVADSLYWLSQNMERADNTAKLLSVRLISILENNDPESGTDKGWQELLELTGNSYDYHNLYSTKERDLVIHFIAFDRKNLNSIYSCISIARENAKMIREIIPIELWEVINDLYLKIKEFPKVDVTNEQLNDFFQMIREKYFLFQGIISTLMPWGDGYQFIMFGKHLERIRSLVRILDIYYHKQPSEKMEVRHHYWSTVLNAVSGYESYLQKYQTFMDAITVSNYLIFDEMLPRSVKYSVKLLVRTFNEMESDQVNAYSKDLHEKLMAIKEELNYASLQEIKKTPHEYFQNLQVLCNEIGLAIGETYYLGEIKNV